MNNVRVCSLCKRVYVYDEFENNGYEDVCNHCKPIDRRIKSDLMDDYMEQGMGFGTAYNKAFNAGLTEGQIQKMNAMV